MAHQIVWFDMPVKDLDRSIRFYSAVLGAPVKKEQMPGMTFAVLPHEQNDVSGILTRRSARAAKRGQGARAEASDRALRFSRRRTGQRRQPQGPIGCFGSS